MKNTLIDAGPLIALFDKDDQYHAQSLSFIKKYNGRLLSTWPVITEVSHMLDFSTKAQMNFMTWTHRGGLDIFNLDIAQLPRLMELTEKFRDVPMDLADATLIVASEQRGIKEIATIDGDFYIYRTVRNKFLKNVFL